MPDDVAGRSSPGRAAEGFDAPGAVEPEARHGRAVRRFLVWCPDWPVVAAALADGLGPLAPAAVFSANRVLACSATARDAGVRRGMRRREAQGRCPELAVSEHDPARDARLFEPVVTAVEQLTPGVEIVRPGLVAVPARGPARYFGSEDAAAEQLVDQVAVRTGVECQVGAADGLFAGVLAARRGVLVAPGGSREFLAPLGIAEIDQPAQRLTTDRAELVDLLRRLGIRTLGEFAALVPGDVATRFGADALLAQRAARGEEERPPDRRRPPPELAVAERLDPPVDRVDAAAFAAKALAERLHLLLGERGLACTRLGISARTENGEQLHRVWRCAEPLTPADTVDRVRWQLDGWLSARSREPRPTSGVAALELCPEEVVGAGGLQLDLMRSATGAADARAGRAFVRVQGLLGPDQVLVGIPSGGRDARDRVTLVPWGAERRPQREPDRPWPGRIPAPSPSVLPESPWPATVLDAAGEPVRITPRLELTAPPHQVLVRGRARTVVGWAGPWPLRERWWDPPRGAADAVGSAAPASGAGTDVAGAGVPPGTVARMQVVLAPDGETGRAEPSTVAPVRNLPGGRPPQPPLGRAHRNAEPNGPAERGARTPGDRCSHRPDGGESGSRAGADFGSNSPDSAATASGGPTNASGGDPDEQGEVALLLVHENDEWWVQGVYR
ncbi:DNA polymerase Y family protein [Saccharopolyspora sp. NFXS83]|uniref:Y-family DNA polymerase n=1 Tax=Saccharopolyspora sp. NFXS83 TaxID=2993560 RepID=UPI003A4E0F82